MNGASELLDQGRRLLSAAGALSGAGAEINLRRRETRSIGWAEGKPSVRGASASSAVCVRILDGGREALLTSADLDPQAVRACFEKARSIAQFSPPDETRRLGTQAASYPAATTEDPALFSTPSDELLERLMALERRILAMDRRLRKVIKFNLSEERAQVAIVNSNGLAVAESAGSAAFVAELLAEQEGQSEIAWDYAVRRRFTDLPVEWIADGVAEAAVRALGGTALATGAYAVVLDPRVGTQLLSLLAEAVSAEAVQLGRSFMAGMAGKMAGSPALTIVDDGLLLDGVASGAFDDEGTPHERTVVIDNGRLENYLYDLRTAARAGARPNGHGIKGAFSAPPSPHPTNFYVAPGTASPGQLLSSEKKVFHIRDVMGLHMADPISGEFSLGASGHLYESGAYARPVRGVTVAGDVKSLLAAVVGVGDDLLWHGSYGCPSLLISSLAIGGA